MSILNLILFYAKIYIRSGKDNLTKYYFYYVINYMLQYNNLFIMSNYNILTQFNQKSILLTIISENGIDFC